MGNGNINYQAIRVSDVDYERLPFGLREGMRNYLEHGIEAGSFMMAVLENNLTQAYWCADPDNKRHLGEIIEWCCAEIPAVSWGSEDRVKMWIQERRAA